MLVIALVTLAVACGGAGGAGDGGSEDAEEAPGAADHAPGIDDRALGSGPDRPRGQEGDPPPGATRPPETEPHDRHTGADAGTDADEPTQQRRPDSGSSTGQPGDPLGTPTRVRLPTIEVDAPVIELDLRADGTIEVPPDGDAAGWYRAGARAGEPGPTVIGAHADWAGRVGVFFELGAVSVGDVVSVEDDAGTVTSYRVERLEQHPKDDFPTLAVYGATAEDTLRLVTCAGEFDRDARSYRDNLVVFASAVD